MSNYLILLIILYAVPAMRVGLFFVPPVDSEFLRIINSVIGRYEWLIRWARDTIVLAVLCFFVAAGIYNRAPFPALWYFCFVILSIVSKIRHVLHARRMAAFSIQHPFIHPAIFFRYYYAGFGIFPVKLPSNSNVFKEIEPGNCSFRSGGRGSIKAWAGIIGLLNTFTLARLVVHALKWKGVEYCREVARSVMIIWGARAAYLASMAVKTEGFEKLERLEGKFIFIFNHKSALDFAIAPFALAKAMPKDRSHFVFKYLAARDHFLDNPFLYNLMGRAMLSVGTIFVDRKSKKASPQLAVAEAVSKLANLDIDIALFPQGTRAFGYTSASGKRMDAGYYTAGDRERLKRIGAHLKKGAAYIAVDTALQLKNKEHMAVHIVPVGLIGTANVLPRKGMLVQSECEVKILVGEPITLTKNEIKNIDINTPQYHELVNKIHKGIDNNLKSVLGVHAELEGRFFTDIRKFLPSTDFEHVAIAMKAWRGEDYLIYTLLDCIYATRPKFWQGELRELCHLLISEAPRESLMQFKWRVVDKLTSYT